MAATAAPFATRCPLRSFARATATASGVSGGAAPRRPRRRTLLPGPSAVAGEEALRAWKPADGGEKWFCGECGSAIFGSNPSHPESIGIRLGTFDDDPGVRPSVRQFVASAAAWEPLPDDGLPRFPASRHDGAARPV